MALIKHNPIIRVIYILLILAMFSGLAWYINYTYNQYTSLSAAETGELISDSTEAESDSGFKTVHKDGFSIAGIRKVFSWSDEKMAEKIQAFWLEFSKNRQVEKMPFITDHTKVYIVYHAYNEKKNTLSATIGYRIDPRISVPKQFAYIHVEPGPYAIFKNKAGSNTIADIWGSTLIEEDNYQFFTDYETYTFDAEGNMTDGTIAVGLKQQQE